MRRLVLLYAVIPLFLALLIGVAAYYIAAPSVDISDGYHEHISLSSR
jgi:hypothetical protein